MCEAEWRLQTEVFQCREDWTESPVHASWMICQELQSQHLRGSFWKKRTKPPWSCRPVELRFPEQVPGGHRSIFGVNQWLKRQRLHADGHHHGTKTPSFCLLLAPPTLECHRSHLSGFQSWTTRCSGLDAEGHSALGAAWATQGVSASKILMNSFEVHSCSRPTWDPWRPCLKTKSYQEWEKRR